jgi:lipopolysaccharide/colanic/teichoic acid biosynthesis glycosyltransferase
MKIDGDTIVKNFQTAINPGISNHIIFVGNKDYKPVEYTQDHWLISTLLLDQLSLGILDGTLEPDAVFIDSNAIPQQMGKLAELLKKHEIPFILYTEKYDVAAKEKAIQLKVDDYLFGALSESMQKRLLFVRKIKAYKNTRKEKPYEINKIKPMQSVKIWRLKRASDIVLSLLAIIILSPILLLIAVIIKLESKGPIFYISKRAGSGYKIFDFYKFRSMRAGADKELKNLSHLNQYAEGSSESVFFKIKDDPRVTPFGQFLRNSSLDELPQLFNVLKGDMSLVGNRPLPLYEAERLTKDQIAWRFIAPAGITGLWQVTKRGQKDMSLDERIHLDMEYAMKNSFAMDMKIIFSTFPALFQKEKV